MSFRADSPVSHSQWPGSDSAKKMSATSGRRCYEQFARLNQGTSWAKMFVEYLIGRTDWWSMRCTLTWKVKATKSSRLYFLLQASTHRTEETESGLLPTPLTNDSKGKENSPSEAKRGSLSGAFANGLLPTPQAIDGNGNGRELRLKKDMKRDPNQPGSWRGDLKDYAHKGMLPTPVASDTEGGISDPRQIKERNGRWIRTSDTTQTEFGAKLRDVAQLLPTPTRRDHQPSISPKALTRKDGKTRADQLSNIPVMIGEHCQQRTGKTSQLSPLFVEEMMGFPKGWTVSPFQSGATNPSKPTETR